MEDRVPELPHMSDTTPAQELTPQPTAVPSAVPPAPVQPAQQLPQQQTVPEPPSQPYPEEDELVPHSRVGIGSGAMLGVLIAVVIFLLLGGLALVAANYGKGTPLAKLAAYIPVEQIPLINTLAKSNVQLLQDVAPASVATVFNNTNSGSEWASSMKITGSGQTADQQKVNIDLTIAGKTAVSPDSKQIQAEYTATGSVSSGVVKVDLGQGGAKYDLLMPDPNTMYFMLHLSDELRQTIDPVLAKTNGELAAAGVTGISLAPTDLFDTYWKLDLKEYSKFMQEEMGSTTTPTTYDGSKYKDAAKKLMAAVGPDLQKSYDQTIGDVTRYAKVNDLGRQTVNGTPARVLSLDIANDSVPPVVTEFMSDVSAIVIAHPAAFQTFCEDIAGDDATKQECATTYSADHLDALKLTDEAKSQTQDELTQVMKEIEFSNLKFYISPVDNSLVKWELAIAPSNDGLAQINASSDSKLDTLSLALSSEEVSRGKVLSVQAPANSKDMIDILRSAMQAEKSLMGSMGTGMMPVAPAGTKPALLAPDAAGLTPAQMQQYQDLMKQYQQNGGTAGSNTTTY
ncbi:MAG TPA: hypothetical protein VFG51_01300 [Candidatus Saccharimonadia bacterium]|nr:hypothetical protein [Candidatus Saccharimonadia bacterium]